MGLIMTDIGLIGPDGRLTQKARDAFIVDVSSLLINGNLDGKGMKNVITALVPIPIKDPTPLIKDPITGNTESLFLFSPDVLAPIVIPVIANRNTSEMYHTIWIDNMYEKIVQAFNVPGAVVAPPVYDPTLSFPDIKLPDKIKFPNLKSPELPLDFAKFVLELIGPKFDPVKFAAELPLNIPKLELNVPKFPEIPKFNLPNVPGLLLPKLTIEFITKVFEVVFNVEFLLGLIAKLPELPGGLFSYVFGIIFDIFYKILQTLPIPISPKSFAATQLVIIKNLTALVIVTAIGLSIGSGGIVKLSSKLLGLL